MAKRKARQDSQKLVDPTSEAWRKLPWRKFEQHVYRIQKRIYRANQRGDTRAVHKLQKLLMKSEAARLLAVRRVTQDNQGKKTAGIDGIKSVPPTDRLAMADQIHPKQWKHLYWLLRTSVRERGTLGFHHPPLSRCQVGLSHQSRRGMVLVHKGKHGRMGSKPSGKACKGSMRGLPQTSLGMTLPAGWASSTHCPPAQVIPLQAAQW